MLVSQHIYIYRLLVSELSSLDCVDSIVLSFPKYCPWRVEDSGPLHLELGFDYMAYKPSHMARQSLGVACKLDLKDMNCADITICTLFSKMYAVYISNRVQIHIYIYIISSGALSFLTFKPYIIFCPPILLLTCSRAMTASKAT